MSAKPLKNRAKAKSHPGRNGKKNRGGRPATGRTPYVAFRGDREAYQRSADAAGLTLSAWLRKVCDAAVAKSG